jgi:hypothetical protein
VSNQSVSEQGGSRLTYEVEPRAQVGQYGDMKLVMIIGLFLAIYVLFSHLKQVYRKNTGKTVDYRVLATFHSNTLVEWRAFWSGIGSGWGLRTVLVRAEAVVLFCLVFLIPILAVITVVAQVLVSMGLISPSAWKGSVFVGAGRDLRDGAGDCGMGKCRRGRLGWGSFACASLHPSGSLWLATSLWSVRGAMMATLWAGGGF